MQYYNQLCMKQNRIIVCKYLIFIHVCLCCVLVILMLCVVHVRGAPSPASAMLANLIAMNCVKLLSIVACYNSVVIINL